MCHLRNITLHDYQESVTIRHTDRHTQTPDKVIPMCGYASQVTQQNGVCFLHHILKFVIYKYCTSFLSE